MKRCMYCGFENDDTAESCARCGYHLLDTPPGQMPPLRSSDTVNAGQAVPAEQEANYGAADAVMNPGTDVQQPESVQTAEPDAAAQAGGGQMAAEPVQGAGEMPPTGMNETAAGQAYPSGDGTYSYPDQSQYAQQNASQTYDGQGYNGQGYNGQGYDAQGYGYAAQAAAQQGYPGQNYGYQDGTTYAGAGAADEEEQTHFPILMEKARKLVRSPFFFLAALLYTIMVVSRAAYLFTGGSMTNIDTFLHTLSVRFGENVPTAFLQQGVDMLKEFLAKLPPYAVYGIEAGLCLPAILIMISLWMMFSGTSPKRKEISTTGFTFARVVKILQLIVVCALMLTGIGVCVSFVVAYVKAQSVERMIFCVIILLIVMLLTVLTILYYIQLLFSIRVIRSNARDGEDIGRIPGFVIFVGLLGCAAAGASMLPMAPDDYIGLVTRGASAAWLLVISIWGIVYKATVKVR